MVDQHRHRHDHRQHIDVDDHRQHIDVDDHRHQYRYHQDCVTLIITFIIIVLATIIHKRH